METQRGTWVLSQEDHYLNGRCTVTVDQFLIVVERKTTEWKNCRTAFVLLVAGRGHKRSIIIQYCLR